MTTRSQVAGKQQQAMSAFQMRMDAFGKYAASLQHYYDLGIPEDLPRTKTILACFQLATEFSQELLKFFEVIGSNLDSLLPDKDNTTQRVNVTLSSTFGKIIERLANDLSVIRSAYDQRIIPNLMIKRSASVMSTLDTADRLAWTARMLFDGYLYRETTVLSYLDKSLLVRIMPYAPVILIGVPATSLNYSGNDPAWTRDFLGIPHEFGHHLYWYGRNKEALEASPSDLSQVPFLREKLKPLEKEWLQNWLEEIFADVIGCMIAGPAGALSIQDLMETVSGSDFDRDNETHPPPLFRPFIYTETLKLMSKGALIPAASALETRWKIVLHDFGLLQEKQNVVEGDSNIWKFTVYQKNQDAFNVDFQIVKQVVQDIYEQVNAVDNPDNAAKRWTGWPSDSQEIDKLYSQFDAERVRKLTEAIEPKDLAETESNISFHKRLKNLRMLENAEEAEKWLAQLDDPGEINIVEGQPSQIPILPAAIWVNLFKFDGWTTGPGGPGNVHKAL